MLRLAGDLSNKKPLQSEKSERKREIVYLIVVILLSMATAHTRSFASNLFIHRYDLWINFNLQSIFYHFFSRLMFGMDFAEHKKAAEEEWKTYSTANSMKHNLKNFFQILTLLPSFSSSLRYQSTASERLKSIINYKTLVSPILYFHCPLFYWIILS